MPSEPTEPPGVEATAPTSRALASYFPPQPESGGVSGYDSRNKAVLLVKSGWRVGEYYNPA